MPCETTQCHPRSKRWFMRRRRFGNTGNLPEVWRWLSYLDTYRLVPVRGLKVFHLEHSHAEERNCVCFQKWNGSGCCRVRTPGETDTEAGVLQWQVQRHLESGRMVWGWCLSEVVYLTWNFRYMKQFIFILVCCWVWKRRNKI